MAQKKHKHQLTENVKLLQKAVLLHNDQVLILQRNGNSKSRPFAWDLPGGNSEWPVVINENLENMHQLDIAREIKEETDISILEQHFTIENMVLFRTFFEAEKGIYSIITGWKVVLPSDFDRKQVELSHEHVAQKWINADELGDIDFGGKKGEFVKEIIRKSF
jgi:8-oxo-dGTP pyrophosphatase MutT (NUDIX family)